MNRWPRRLLLLLIILVWLGIMLFPTLAVVLARNGQIQLGNSDGRHWRLFLLQEPDFEGLGLERARPVAPPLSAPGAACLQTSVGYWLWAGEAPGQDVAFCQCTDPATGASVPDLPPACQPAAP
jgi:hypothetical protein